MTAPTTPATPVRDIHRTDLPLLLALTAAVICGMFAALVAQVVLAERGIELSGVWRDLLSARGLQLRSAGAWWLIAASAFLVGAAVAGTLTRLPLPWVRLRFIRWTIGAALVFGLAHVGHSSALHAGAGITVHVIASLAALCSAALMALFGAYFAARR